MYRFPSRNCQSDAEVVLWCDFLQEMRHFEVLREKIAQMEARHRLREQQLQQLMQQQHVAAAQEAVLEATRWRSIVDAKNREIDKFRGELDAILEILRQLQRQGVVVPYNDALSMPLQTDRIIAGPT
jgi:biopolymer transport protein ExbB/TolQ